MAEVDVMGTLFGGLRRVGEAGIDIGKAVASIPVSIATALPDFVEDPDVFLSGGRLGAVGALLSKDYRQRQKQDLEAGRQWDKIVKTKQTMDWLDDLFAGRDPDARHGAALQAEQAGVPGEQIDTALGLANQQDQKSVLARQGLRQAVPGLPEELVEASSPTPESAISTIIAARNADAVAARSADSSARSDRRLTLSERREARLAAQPPPETPESKFGRRLKERSATTVYDQTAENTASGLAGPISTIDDPQMRGQLQEALPAFSARQAEKEAGKIVDQALPLNSRRNIATRKAAKLALRDRRKAAEAEAAQMANPAAELPSDPAGRAAAAAELAERLLATGMPPETVVKQLLQRGFTPEEIPE